ncbi:MAG: hypothetical protein MI923_05790, partial [Phycisphaerales bacterium]|nr:hypothetical protein [Phycisphaerales bacterium]
VTAFLIDLSFSSNKKSYKTDFRIHTTQRKEFCEWRQISVRFFFFNSNIDVVSFPETNFLTPNSEIGESSLKQGVPRQNRGTWQT